jgi:hypothetical protein
MDKAEARIVHTLDQLSAGLGAGDRKAERNARIMLARIASSGSVDLLAKVFRGIVSTWDTIREQ